MKYLMSLYSIVILILFCEPKNKSEFKVEYKGTLKDMMHKGDISVKSSLEIFKNMQHFYALGAIENLKGEILILDSKPFNTMVIDSSLHFDDSFTKNATLLVYASVSEWNSITIPDSVVTDKQLEVYIEEMAKKNKINVNKPFPFLVQGKLKSFDWHVINWKDQDMEHSHEKHIASGLYGEIKNREVEMLGFYSNSHHTIFTHHTTNIHMHVKTMDNKIAGHIDGLKLGTGMVLKLPI